MIPQLPRILEEYLLDPQGWCEDIARQFSTHENIVLTQDYWDATCLIGDYFAEHHIASDTRHAIKHLAVRPRHKSRNALFGLFH